MVNNGHQDAYRGDKCSDEEGALGRGEVGVSLCGEDAQDVVVFVDGLAEVAAFLLVPPVAIRVAKLALDEGRVDVASVLLYDVSLRGALARDWMGEDVPFRGPHRHGQLRHGGSGKWREVFGVRSLGGSV